MGTNYFRFFFTDSICNGSNGSDVFLPHEKIDSCKTYVRCYSNVPTGKSCQPRLCFDHQLNNCGWCTSVICESELEPTTAGKFLKLFIYFFFITNPMISHIH